MERSNDQIRRLAQGRARQSLVTKYKEEYREKYKEERLIASKKVPKYTEKAYRKIATKARNQTYKYLVAKYYDEYSVWYLQFKQELGLLK